VSILAAGSIGVVAALFPAGWIQLFSHEPEVVAVGVDYLVRVAPFYGFIGLGMALYFASQGAGRMAWPFTAGVVRLVTVMAAGWYWTAIMHGSLAGLFWIVAVSHVLFGAINAAGMLTGLSWRPGPSLQLQRPG
jgi:Na+-driven multidrug efflux pump